MLDKKISVIIPVYNVKDYIEKCVESVLNQTYKNLEIILVDDGSTDTSGDLCDTLSLKDNRIKVIHKANGGLSSARNAGLNSATGNYIGFIDSDDYIATDFYETLIAKSVDDKTIACSHIVRVDENGNITPRNDVHLCGDNITGKEFIRELLLHTGDVSVCSKLFSTKTIGTKRFDETKLNEDLLFIIDVLSDIEQIVFTKRIGYYYFCRSGSISSRYGKAIEDMVDNSLIVKDWVTKVYPDLRSEAERFALTQHMAFLLLIPKQLRTRENQNYREVCNYMRVNFFKNGLFNKHITNRNKMIMLGLVLMPSLVASIYQRNRN